MENEYLTHDERIEQFREVVAKHDMLVLSDTARYDRLITKLDEEYGYFDCPASLNHHGNYDGGLFEHSMEVAKQLKDIWRGDKECRSPYLIGLFHDLCKCVQYMQNPADGTWFWNEDCFWTGHGSLSVMITQQIFAELGFVPLSSEELLCIRWHMGAFDKKENWGFYTNSVKEYPNVLMTHTADMLASQVEGK